MKNLIIIALVALLAACGDRPAPQAQQPQAPQIAAQAAPAAAPGQPVIINNTQPANNGATDMLLGGMMGYMLGSAGSNHSAPAPQVVERRVIVREVARDTVSRPAPQAAAPAAAPVGPLPKVTPATPPAAKPFAYGTPPAPKPKVTYGAGFAPVNTKPAPPPVMSKPGAYSMRR